MNPILSLSARQIAHQVARRELTAEAVARAFIDHITATDATVHAWQHFDADAVLAQARALDTGPTTGALQGVPIGVKDLLDTGDMPTTYGSPIYTGHRPATDAACVGTARAAGAVVMGKTVTTEFATMQAGPTVNPHSPPGHPHTPGGSSSGSAAAVAAHMVPLALGTQTAASVVRPAAFCGVVGYKPTHGLLPVTGVKLQSPSLDTVGGFARTVDDVAFFIGTLARWDLTPQRPVSLRVGLCRTPHWADASPDAQRVWTEAGRTFEQRGATLVDIDLPASWAALVPAQIDLMGFDAAAAFAPERRTHAHLLSAPLTQMLNNGDAVSVQRVMEVHAMAALAREQFQQLMGSVDVLIAPSAPGVAPAGLAFTGNPLFSRLWSLLGAPCVHVPCGSGEHGLPLGVTVVGPRWGDAMALSAAQVLEG